MQLTPADSKQSDRRVQSWRVGLALPSQLSPEFPNHHFTPTHPDCPEATVLGFLVSLAKNQGTVPGPPTGAIGPRGLRP